MCREKQWFEQHVETDDGYPNMDFEDWYQKGLFCHYFKFLSSLIILEILLIETLLMVSIELLVIRPPEVEAT